VPGTILPAHPPRKGVSKDGEASAGAARCDRGAEADPILWRVFAPVPKIGLPVSNGNVLIYKCLCGITLSNIAIKQLINCIIR
jgi:hypothetical protein